MENPRLLIFPVEDWLVKFKDMSSLLSYRRSSSAENLLMDMSLRVTFLVCEKNEKFLQECELREFGWSYLESSSKIFDQVQDTSSLWSFRFENMADSVLRFMDSSCRLQRG